MEGGFPINNWLCFPPYHNELFLNIILMCIYICIIQGYTIPSRTQVELCPALLHHQPYGTSHTLSSPQQLRQLGQQWDHPFVGFPVSSAPALDG